MVYKNPISHIRKTRKRRFKVSPSHHFISCDFPFRIKAKIFANLMKIVPEFLDQHCICRKCIKVYTWYVQLHHRRIQKQYLLIRSYATGWKMHERRTGLFCFLCTHSRVHGLKTTQEGEEDGEASVMWCTDNSLNENTSRFFSAISIRAVLDHAIRVVFLRGSAR